MTITLLITLALISAVPVGPSLYRLFQLNRESRRIRGDLISVYLLADIIHIAAAWLLSSLILGTLWAKGLLLLAAAFMFLSSYRLIKPQKAKLSTSANQSSTQSERGEVFLITLLNPGIFLFYLSLLSNYAMSAQALSLFVLMFSIFILLLLAGSLQFPATRPAVTKFLNISMSVVFAGLGFHFLIQI